MQQFALLGLLLAILFVHLNCAITFNLGDTGMSGSTIYNTLCNIQTTLEFKFNPNSIFSSPVHILLHSHLHHILP